MKCENVKEWLSALLDGEVAAPQAAEILEHIKRCPDCAEELESLRSLSAMYRALPEPVVPADMEQRIWAAIKQRQPQASAQTAQRPTWHFPWLNWPRLAYASGVLAVLCVLVIVYNAPDSLNPMGRVGKKINEVNGRGSSGEISGRKLDADGTMKLNEAGIKDKSGDEDTDTSMLNSPEPVGSPADRRSISRLMRPAKSPVAKDQTLEEKVKGIESKPEAAALRDWSVSPVPQPVLLPGEGILSKAKATPMDASKALPAAGRAPSVSKPATTAAPAPGTAPAGSGLAAAAPESVRLKNEPLSLIAKKSPAGPTVDEPAKGEANPLPRKATDLISGFGMAGASKGAIENKLGAAAGELRGGAANAADAATASGAGLAGGAGIAFRGTETAGLRQDVGLFVKEREVTQARSKVMEFAFDRSLPIGETFSLAGGVAAINIETISFGKMANGAVELQMKAAARIAKPVETAPKGEATLAPTSGMRQERISSATAELVLYVDGEANGAAEINAGAIRFSLPSDETPDAEIVNIAVIPLNASRLIGVRHFSIGLEPRP